MVFSVSRKVRAFFALLCVFLMISMQQRVHAQALPIANFVVNRAMAGAITRVALARGFAANDPRIAATLLGVGKVSTGLNVVSTVAGIGLSLAGAPVWLTVAAGLGILAAGTYFYSFTKDGGSASIAINNGKLVATLPEPKGQQYTSPGSIAGLGWGSYVDQGFSIYRTSSCMAVDPCARLPAFPSPEPNYSFQAGDVAIGASTLQEMANWWKAANQSPSKNISTSVMYWSPSADGNSYSLAGYMVWVDDLGNTLSTSTWVTFVHVAKGLAPIVGTNFDNLSANLPDDVRASKISDTALAQMVDSAWRLAAGQPGYEGLPYSATSPVTSGEVTPWMNANPDAVPSLGDLLVPASASGSTDVPISVSASPATNTGNPSSAPGTGTDVNVVNTPNVNVVNTVKVDFGTDPGVAEPTLEATPTGTQILLPLTILMPELRHFQTPGHSGTCPKLTFDVFGKSIVMDSHCIIAEQYRTTLAAVMAVVWILVGLFILLSA